MGVRIIRAPGRATARWGRDAWMAEERDTSFVVPDYPPTQYPVVERDDVTNRAFVADVLAGITKLSKNGAEGQSPDPSDDTIAIVDVRNGKEYMGTFPTTPLIQG